MKDIARRLISGEIDIIEALLLAREFANSDFKEFVDNELDGYSANSNLPEYRKFECPIVLDYQTPWGEIHKEVELDVTELNRKQNINLNYSPMFNDIGFIQTNLKTIKTDYGIRPFNSNMLDLFKACAIPNIPNSRIISGGHKFAKHQMQLIIDNTKKELIKRLQDNSNLNSINNVSSTLKNEIQKKTVFISYAWQTNEDNQIVVSFLEFLRQNGYDARMDKYHSQQESAINFKRMMHDGMYHSDKVIIILSETYKRKSDNLEDGVGEEVKIIQEEIGKQKDKYILVSFNTLTKELIKRIVPNVLIDRDIIDLKEDQDKNGFSRLFSKLNNTPIINFSDVAEATPEAKEEEIKPFKL